MKSTAPNASKKEAETDELSAIVNSLRRIVRAVRISSHTAEQTLGISGAQLFVLQQLAEHPAASLGDLAARTLTDQSSVSVVVSRLVEKKLVVRRTSATDRRRHELSLTAAGRACLHRSPEPAQVRLVTALRKVPAGELHVLARVLDDVAREMDTGPEPPSMFFEQEAALARKKGKRRNAE